MQKSAMLACLALALLCCNVAQAESDQLVASEGKLEFPVLLERFTFPYEGPGTVDVLDDGTMVVFLGKPLVFEKGAGKVVAGATEFFLLALDPANSRLVEQKGAFFIDRDGEALRELGLSEQHVQITPFFGRPEALTHSRYSVMSISGDLAVSYDQSSGAIELDISGVSALMDEVDVAQYFSYKGNLKPLKSAQTSNSSLLNAPKNADSGGEVRGGPDPQPSGPTCSVTCPGGANCQITCPSGKAAVCFCRGPNPICECGPIPAET